MKKGRHRRYEEARALKRGGELDIDAIFTDLDGDSARQRPVDDEPRDDAEPLSYDLDDDDR